MKKIFLILILLSPVVLLAQEFKVDGQIRPRFESQKGFKTLRPAAENEDNVNNAVTQRSRLNVFFKNKEERVKIKLTLQDVRTWGTTKQLNNDSESLGIHEAWADILLTDELSMKVGRQELVYDNSRIFGNVGWAQQARTHDVGMLKYKGAVNIDAGFAIAPNNPNYTPMSNYGFQYLWVNKKTDNLNLSFLVLNNGTKEVDKANYSQTIGTYITYQMNQLGFVVSGYYQTGKNRFEQDLSAYNILGEVSLKATDNLKFTLGGEMISGTDMGDDSGESKSFNPFYGTNHKFNGLMDYFYVGNHLNDVGLIDLYGKAGFKTGAFKAGVHAHSFMAAAKVIDPANSEEQESNLGFELDLVLGYKVSKSVNLSGGFSTLFATESMEIVKEGGDSEKPAMWGWVMLTVSPTFFTSKKE